MNLIIKISFAIIGILALIPIKICLGIYKCLSYGSTEQIFYLVVSLSVMIINSKCSKSIGFEDGFIIIVFIGLMDTFSKLKNENTTLSELAKILTSKGKYKEGGIIKNIKLLNKED